MAIERFEIDTEQWAVINRSEFIRAMDRFIRKESAEELLELIIAAAPRPEAVQQADQWTPGVSNYDRSIHSNPDAKAWADLFVQTFPGLADKHDLMLGWFANAMMAMHDHMAPKPAPRPVPTSERLPTEADADCMGCVWAFGLDLWQYEQVQFVDPLHHSHWQRTGLARPAEPERELSPEFRQAAWDALKSSGKKVADAKKAEPDGGAV